MPDREPELRLETFFVKQVMIHEIPKVKIANKNDVRPVITDACIELTDSIRRYLRERITDSLASQRFAAVYDAARTPAPVASNGDDPPPTIPAKRRDERSAVPQLVVDFFTSNGDDLIPTSQKMAQCLYQMQEGSASEGMLVVVDGTIGTGTSAGKCLAILKLEKSDALTVTPATNENGESTFDVAIHEITLKRDAKVFKAALFRRAANLSDVKPWVSDNQSDPASFGPDVASFFLRFLGCRLRDTADRQTKNYIDFVKRFVNESVDDDQLRADIMIAAMVDVNSNAEVINPTEFAHNHMPPKEEDEFLKQLAAADGSVGIIAKDKTLVGKRLDQVVAKFEGNITVSGPRSEMVTALRRDEKGVWQLNTNLRSIGPRGS